MCNNCNCGLKLRVQKTVPSAKIPSYAYDGDACMDLSIAGIYDPESSNIIIANDETSFIIRHDELSSFVKKLLKEWDFSLEQEKKLINSIEKKDTGFCEFVVILPGETIVFDTGLIFDIPNGYEMKIYPRSSLGIKKNLELANTVGVIDSTFRDSVRIALRNKSNLPVVINRGERVVQMQLQKVLKIDIEEVSNINTDTTRGTKGTGSSGVL